MIQPALTPEEWASNRVSATGDTKVWRDPEYGHVVVLLPGANWHPVLENRAGVAALCLHGQPFGFTREDVRAIRNGVTGEFGFGPTYPHWVESMESLADRIEALLPPEGE